MNKGLNNYYTKRHQQILDIWYSDYCDMVVNGFKNKIASLITNGDIEEARNKIDKAIDYIDTQKKIYD